MESEKRNRIYRRLDGMADWLDDSISLPGTRFRIGWDAIIGLIPVGGDAVSGLLSLYIIIEAIRLGASTSLIIRMLFNVALDVLIGSIPLVGDIFDFGWKANVRNVRLIQRFVMEPDEVRRESNWRVGWVSVASSIVVLIVIVLLIWMVWLLGGLIIDGLQQLWIELFQ